MSCEVCLGHRIDTDLCDDACPCKKCHPLPLIWKETRECQMINGDKVDIVMGHLTDPILRNIDRVGKVRITVEFFA